MLGWPWCGFHKKRTGTHCVEVVFLHQVRSTDSVVHSGVSGEQNMITLFFILWWNRYGFDKKCTGTRYTELVFLSHVESAGHVLHSSASRS
jgi:hypothetical protein